MGMNESKWCKLEIVSRKCLDTLFFLNEASLEDNPCISVFVPLLISKTLFPV